MKYGCKVWPVYDDSRRKRGSATNEEERIEERNSAQAVSQFIELVRAHEYASALDTLPFFTHLSLAATRTRALYNP